MKNFKKIIFLGAMNFIALSCKQDSGKMGRQAAVEYCTCMLGHDSYLDKPTYFYADSICLISLNKKYGYRMSIINKHHGDVFADSVKNETQKKEAIIFEDNFMDCFLVCSERNISYHMPQDTFLIYTHKDREKCGCE